MLGTAAQAQHSTLITHPAHHTPTKLLLADAFSRLKQAETDAELLTRMVSTTTEVPHRYAAWLMLVRSLAVRSDFDMRILPAHLMTTIVTSLNAMLINPAKHVLGLSHLTDIMVAQVQSPGQFGGLFLTNPFIKLQAAHVASLAAFWKHTRTTGYNSMVFQPQRPLAPFTRLMQRTCSKTYTHPTFGLTFLGSHPMINSQGICLALRHHPSWSCVHYRADSRTYCMSYKPKPFMPNLTRISK